MHEISFNSDGNAEAVFAHRPAWHGLGTVVPHHLTPSEALVAAGLTWTVEQLEVLYKRRDETKYQVVPNHVVNVRSDDGRALGVVGRDYVPIQHAEQAEFIEALVGEGEAVVECLGALRGGSRNFWTVKLGDDGFEVLDGDRVKRHLIVCSSHDGSLAFRAFHSATRVVCSNTLSVALADAPSGIAIRHTGNVAGRIDEAKKVLGLANQHFQRLEETLQELALVEIGGREAEAFVARVLPFQAQATDRQRRSVERTRDQVLTNFMGGVGSELSGASAWGLLNGFTELASHMRKLRGVDDRQKAERRFESLLLGGAGQQLGQRAFKEAVTLLDTAA